MPVAYRRPVEAFLEAPPPAGRWAPVFSHNDLGIEHVLVDPGTWTVTGVIDWSDAAIVDPAVDFGLLYRDLGPAATHAALGSYRTGANDLADLEERAASTPAARSSRTWPTASRRDRVGTATRALPPWHGCSPRVDRQVVTCIY